MEKHQLQCSTEEEYAGSWFSLYVGGSQKLVAQKKALPTESSATFEVHEVGPDEQFHCSYEIWEAGKAIRSPLSQPANITEVHYLKPSIVASPSTEILVGQDWTLHCLAPFSGVSFVFYQARDFRYEVTPQGNANMAEFSLKNVSEADEGRYTCYYHSLTDPVIWSNASNPVVLKVLGRSDVSRYQEVMVDSAGKHRVNCSMPTVAEGWFHLYVDGEFFAETRAWANGTSASFCLTEDALSNLKGKLSCQFGENQLNDTISQTQESILLSTDFTAANSIRLGLGITILVAAVAFVADAFWTERHQGN
ncbi:PREDICTED: osteoclast-associated immunoglobulin-like receptor [Thamnophis sirtalis]|uniref:Osteoclast-associated immunoglobulin-like receptor n=1 Tax=Thamnophis sirtalis TaxID=35019 RepID=A0A6I9YDK7_9SAUR|nr:PREDICTED: osteoclast-associated immunoglobulin-like receptor [Thamnophis sirtalis]